MNKAAPYKTLLPLMILLGLGLLMAGSASDAIDLKDPVNLNQLGYALVIKDSTQVDLARTYFSKAAELNYPAAIYNLAVLDDINGKYPQAAQGYLKAAKLMLPEAACQIGLIYSIGIGLPQNDLLAYRWLLFGSAYASDQDRDFWLRLKDDVATRLSQTEIRTIQNDVSELVQKQAVEVNDGRKELLKGYDIAAIQLSNGQPIPVGNIASKQKAHQVSPEQCIGCQLCLDRCPVKAIRIVDSKAVIDKDKCISCGICVNGDGDEYGGCPVSAITVH